MTLAEAIGIVHTTGGVKVKADRVRIELVDGIVIGGMATQLAHV